MSTALPASPLLAIDGLFDERQRAVVERVSAAERAHILALPSDDPLDPKRRFRVEATRGELWRQPAAIEATLAANDAALTETARRLTALRPDRVFLVGAGDSLAVMIAARSALEGMLGLPCEPVQSLEFAYYQRATVTPRTAVVCLSSSGETTRTVEALLVAQAAGAYTIAVTNTAGSTLDVEARSTLLVHATRVGWPTQSSTAALALLLELAVRVGEETGAADAAALRRELDAAPGLMSAAIAGLDGSIAAIAADEAASGSSMTLFSGGGPNWAAAVVGSAKVKECTPDHAVAIEVEEYHHYNSQKAGEPLWLLVPSGPSVSRAIETGTDAHRWGGRLYVVTTEGEHRFDALADRVLAVPAVREEISPLLYFLPAQLVGYHLGMAQFALAEGALS